MKNFILLLVLLFIGVGCKTVEVEYKLIPADRYQYPMTNEVGVVGWFVPDSVHADLMEAVVKVEYYKNLLKDQ